MGHSEKVGESVPGQRNARSPLPMERLRDLLSQEPSVEYWGGEHTRSVSILITVSFVITQVCVNDGQRCCGSLTRPLGLQALASSALDRLSEPVPLNGFDVLFPMSS